MDVRLVAATITENSFTATNDGELTGYPLITFTQPHADGNASAPITLKVFPAGAPGYIELTLDLSLQAGDELVIDCYPTHRSDGILYTPHGGETVNGLYLLGTTGIVNTIGNRATFPYFLPGINTGSWARGCAKSVSFAYNVGSVRH
jgi:hypothetical protein